MGSGHEEIGNLLLDDNFWNAARKALFATNDRLMEWDIAFAGIRLSLGSNWFCGISVVH